MPDPDGINRREEMENTMTSPDLAVEDVIDALDSFYCHNHVVALWADAVANRLEGLAIYLLSDELPEVAEPGAEQNVLFTCCALSRRKAMSSASPKHP
jgi:hypothetical protein